MNPEVSGLADMAGLPLEPSQGRPKDDRTQDTGIVSVQIPEDSQQQRIVSLWRSRAGRMDDSLESAADSPVRDLEIVLRLKVEPQLRGGAEVP